MNGTVLVVCGALLFATACASAQDNHEAFVLFLLNEENGPSFVDDITIPLKESEGSIVRSFQVRGDAKGNIALGKVNRMYVATFPKEESSRRFLENEIVKRELRSERSNLKVVAGRPIGSLSRLSGELYILKISNFVSNNGVAQRVSDEINSFLRKNYDFHPDIAIKTVSTMNLKRADEIAIFLYKEASKQKEVYGNKDLMTRIGNFNKEYLTSFVYLELEPLGGK